MHRRQRITSLGRRGAPAILSYPEEAEPRAVVIVLPGGGVSYDKRWAARWLPLKELPVLRAYVDLPLHGERMAPDLRERHRRDRLREFFGPAVLGMAEEIPSIVDDVLASTSERGFEAVGICGWSIGGLAAFLASMQEHRIKGVAGFAIPSAAKHLRLKELPTDEDGLELLDKLDLSIKAELLYPRSILLMHGVGDRWVDVESSRALHAALRPIYRMSPERLQYREYTDVAHDPCASGFEKLEEIRDEIRSWLAKTLLT